jgi:hypothetical protein
MGSPGWAQRGSMADTIDPRNFFDTRTIFNEGRI